MSSIDLTKYGLSPEIKIQRTLQSSDWTAGGPDGSFQHSAATQFVLPLTSKVFLHKRASATGNVEITTSPSQDNGSALVDVNVKHNRGNAVSSLSDALHVLHLSGPDGENGVGVFDSADSASAESGTDIQYKITLPVRGAEVGNKIQSLSVDVPNTSYKVHGLQGKLLFDNISLIGSNGSIDVESVEVLSQGAFQTSHGQITGTFHAHDALALRTSHAPVDVQVGLNHKPDGKPAKIDVRTSNSPLKATFNLASTASSGGFYEVATKTSHEDTDIHVTNIPLGSKLELATQTSHKQATVTLPPEFEGEFCLRTSSGDHVPTVNANRNTVDPSGQGRERKVEIKTYYGEVHGNVRWGDEPGKGELFIKTSSANIILNV